MALLARLDRELRTPAAPHGIVSLQCAGSAAASGEILDSWAERSPAGVDRRRAARLGLLLDFPLLLAYGATLAFACLWAAARTRGLFAGRLLASLGLAAAAAGIAAALCDGVENLALMTVLRTGPSAGPAKVAWICASLKFNLIGGALAYLAIALLALGWDLQRRAPLVQFLVLCRYPILTAALLVGFGPLAVLALPAMLGNLLALEGSELVAVAALAPAAAWTALLNAGSVLLYGPRRFRLRPRPRRLAGWMRRHRIALTAYLAAPLLITALFVSGEPWRALPFLLLGIAAALGLALTAALLQRRFGDPGRTPEEVLVALPREGHARPVGAAAMRPGRRAPRARSGLLAGYLSPGGRLLPGHAQAAAFALLTLLVYGALYRPLRPDAPWFELPTLAYLLLLLIGACWALSGLAFFFDRLRIPTLVIVVALSLASDRVYEADHFFRVTAAPDSPPLTVEAAFDAAEGEAGEGEGPVVVVAASGGGIAASLWTARVLTALQAEPGLGEELVRSVRLVSAVSGGSVGTLYWLDSFGPDGPPPASAAPAVLARAGASSLSASAWGAAYPDLWRGFAGLAVPLFADRLTDRGWSLEAAWRRQLVRPGASLAGWREAVRSGRLPAAVFNATEVETGEQFLLTPLAVPADWGVGSLTAGCPRCDLEVATAARLSATFPWVTPISRPWLQSGGAGAAAAGSLPDVHLADGGYYDNDGVVTAIRWLETLLERRPEALAGRGAVIVLIRGWSFEPIPGVAHRPPPGCLIPGSDPIERGWFYATAGPILAAGNTLFSTQVGRGGLEIDLLRDKWQARGLPVAAVVLELPVETPFSWKLTSGERQRILDAWEAPSIREQRQRLRRCFRSPASCS